MKIEIDGLSCRIGQKEILKDISAAFWGQRIIGIIGPNGCGKTTLLRHIYREMYSQNRVFLDGQELFSYSPRLFAQKLAVLAQRSSQLDEHLTVGDMVRMGRYPYKKLFEQYGKKDEEIVDEALEKTGLLGFKQRHIGSLSGGEIQRALIAKCFAQTPEAIILDEPANHLDVKYKLELMQLLKQFPGLVLLTIHDLNLAAGFCDYLYAMKQGRIYAQGAPKEVLTEELLEELFEVKFRVIPLDGRLFLCV